MLCGPNSGTREKSNEIARVWEYTVRKFVALDAHVKDVKPFSAKHRDPNIEILLENPQKILQSVKVSIPMCCMSYFLV